MPTKARIQIRRDTKANWLAAPSVVGRGILREGELGFEIDTGMVKVGDGSTAWAGLAYLSGGPGTGSDLAAPTEVLFKDAGGNTTGDPGFTFESVGGIEPTLSAPILHINSTTVSNPTNKLYNLASNLQWSGGLVLGGNLNAVTKSFDIPHPSKKKGRLVYGSLESPYHGVRLTGRDTTKNGKCVIKLPKYIKDLVKEEDCTVHLSNYRHGKVLYTENIDIAKNRITIKVAEPVKGEELEFFWDFTATRKDVPDLVVEP